MNTVKLESISEVKADKNGVRLGYTATFSDPKNPFSPHRSRYFSQTYTDDTKTAAIWKAGDPAIIKDFLKKEIPGTIANFETEDYLIEGTDRMANTYSCVVLGHENAKAVLKAAGKVMKGSEAKAEVAEPAKDEAAF